MGQTLEITFKPLARGYFRCNQMPELGRLKKSALNRIRRQFGKAPKNGTSKTKFRKVETRIPIVNRDYAGDAKCPHCKEWHFGVPLRIVRCGGPFGCGKEFRVV